MKCKTYNNTAAATVAGFWCKGTAKELQRITATAIKYVAGNPLPKITLTLELLQLLLSVTTPNNNNARIPRNLSMIKILIHFATIGYNKTLAILTSIINNERFLLHPNSDYYYSY